MAGFSLKQSLFKIIKEYFLTKEVELGLDMSSTCMRFYDDGFSAICPECDCKCHTCDNNGCLTCSGIRITSPECHCPNGFYQSGLLSPGDEMCTVNNTR